MSWDTVRSEEHSLPRPTSETLWGLKLSSSRSCLRPSTQENAKPPIPLPISTGPPPAKEKKGVDDEQIAPKIDQRMTPKNDAKQLG